MITIRHAGPTRDSFPPGAVNPNHQPSGRMTALALGPDGNRMYAGSWAGVWRSDDRGQTWRQLTWPQPGFGILQADVPGALLAPHVFDLAVSPADSDIVLVSAVASQFVAPRDGIYRTTDGGAHWTLVITSGNACHIAWAPDDPRLVYVAMGSSVAISSDAGATWTPVFVGSSVWHLAVGPGEPDGIRRVYGVGDSTIWGSLDGGATWAPDMGVNTIRTARQLIRDFQESCDAGGLGGFGGRIAYAAGTAGQVLAIDPANPLKVYLATEGGATGPSYYHRDAPDGTLCNTTCGRLADEASLWAGDFSPFAATGSAQWTQVPGPPVPADATPSGNTFVVTHAMANGHLLFFSDNSHVFVSMGQPAAVDAWHRLDGSDVSAGPRGNRLHIHVDPHAIAVSRDFGITLTPVTGVDPPYDQCSVLSAHLGGTIWMANDGGVQWSDDGGQAWNRTIGLETLDPVNVVGLFSPGKPPALYFGCGDNHEFFSRDGGASWADTREGCGDCDCWFADNARADQVVEFLPRRGEGVVSVITSSNPSEFPDASNSAQKRYVPSTRKLVPGTSETPPRLVPYAGSGLVLRGYRPLIRTLATELPLPDGDFVFIDQYLNGRTRLVRTTAISSITQVSDWSDPAKAQQIGPDLPAAVDIVQASGGHANPVFYVGDRVGNVYRLNPNANTWEKVIPRPPVMSNALRWFVDPFEPTVIYALDFAGVKVSVDGGASWAPDMWLTHCLTLGRNLRIGASLLNDMVFMRGERQTRFALGTAGVFWTPNLGVEWLSVLNSIALPGRPESAFFDPLGDPSDRALYVVCEGRGLLRIGGIPPLSPFTPAEPIDLMLFAAILEA